jgi:hypothetical protein
MMTIISVDPDAAGTDAETQTIVTRIRGHGEPSDRSKRDSRRGQCVFLHLFSFVVKHWRFSGAALPPDRRRVITCFWEQRGGLGAAVAKTIHLNTKHRFLISSQLTNQFILIS